VSLVNSVVASAVEVYNVGPVDVVEMEVSGVGSVKSDDAVDSLLFEVCAVSFVDANVSVDTSEAEGFNVACAGAVEISVEEETEADSDDANDVFVYIPVEVVSVNLIVVVRSVEISIVNGVALVVFEFCNKIWF